MSLPEYVIERVEINDETGSRSMLIVKCPRKPCGGEFWVPLRWTYLATVIGADNQMVIIYGRSCPWCCKTARIPAEHARKKPKVKRAAKR